MINIKFLVNEVKEKFKKMVINCTNLKPVMNLIAVKAYKEVIDHFDSEMGTDGKWPTWRRKQSDGTYRYYSSRPTKRGGNKLLQDTGMLRNSLRFKGFEKEAQVYDGSKNGYGKYHQFGTKNMPKRDFLWVTTENEEEYAKMIEKYVIGGK